MKIFKCTAAQWQRNVQGVRRFREQKKPRFAALIVGASLVLSLHSGAAVAAGANGALALVYATYFGGSGDENARVAVDGEGYVYIAGTTTSTNLPTTPGADRELGGSQDAYAARFSPDGMLVYCTYLGGACEDQVRDIAVDQQGNAYVTGQIGNCHFSDLRPGVLVAKLSPTGELLYQYTFGRPEDFCVGLGIAVDSDGYAYVTGVTQSAGFPTTPGAFQTNWCAGFLSDGFVAKVNPEGTDLVYCTYLCGTAHESPNAIAVDSLGNAYIGGNTVSHDFPLKNAFQPTNRVGVVFGTGFVTKLDPTGSQLIYSTYLGGTTLDSVLGIAVDAEGNAYVTGETIGGAFPTTPGVVQAVAPSPLCYFGGLCSDAFVTKFSPDGAVIYSTFLAGETDDLGNRIAVDALGNAYVAGNTASLQFPIRKAFQERNAGVTDVFLTQLNPDGTRILLSTYLGGGRPTNSTAQTEGTDQASGLAFDPAWDLYVSGYTVSADFPVTPGAFQTNWGGGYCYLPIAPCGDCFLSKITTKGPATVPATRLEVDPAEVRSGGVITATWAGIAAPMANDQLVLYRLGDGTDYLATVYTNYLTTGAAAGTLNLQLPGNLAPGSYELRLMGLNGAQVVNVIARSEPLMVTEFIALVAAREPGNRIHLRVAVSSAGTYRLEASPSLAPADWQVVTILEIGADHAAEWSEEMSAANQAKFFRVSR